MVSASGAVRGLAVECLPGVVSIPRSPGELDTDEPIPNSDPANLVASATAQVAACTPDDLGQVRKALPTVAADPKNPASLSQREISSSASKAGAVCGSSARTDLCGGRSAMAVPTAIL